ncbi:jg11942 [Pararge aegeria aegeria]|uniref:Jg11942 protein n=1 Tax=Pararge aegeria aegeria TaxID=348720 RepID=A0A8S4SC18_9NEOP|nr:jg11942 [Pararge aegeria aegeria]
MDTSSLRGSTGVTSADSYCLKPKAVLTHGLKTEPRKRFRIHERLLRWVSVETPTFCVNVKGVPEQHAKKQENRMDNGHPSFHQPQVNASEDTLPLRQASTASRIQKHRTIQTLIPYFAPLV